MRISRKVAVGLTGALSALALTASTLAPAQAAPDSDAKTATDWLASKVSGGVLHAGGYDQYGPTLDAFFAFKQLGVRKGKRKAILDNFAVQLGSYVGSDGEYYAGATGKLTTAVLESGRKPTAFGGVDLVARLKSLVVTAEGPEEGHAGDVSEWGDYSNSIGQSWVVRAFSELDKRTYARLTAHFLLKQQCSNGYFRQSLESSDFTCDTGRLADPEANKASVDATSYAVIALRAAQDAGVKGLGDDIKQAVRWLKRHQNDNGSFSANDVPNANTTGLAAVVLAPDAPKAAARATRWVARRQVTSSIAKGTALVGNKGAVAYNPEALAKGRTDGITDGTLAQWFLATAQSAVALDLQ